MSKLPHSDLPKKNNSTQNTPLNHSNVEKQKENRFSELHNINQQELVRLLHGLTQQTSFRDVKQILHLFKRLDHGSHVSLSHIADLQARKKLRHCFHTLGIPPHSSSSSSSIEKISSTENSSKTYKAPRQYRGHLKSYIKSLLKQISTTLDIPWSAFKKRKALATPLSFTESQEKSQDALKPDLSSMSLMEAYAQGHYGKKKLKTSSFKQEDLWGKSRVEQALATKNYPSQDGEPWLRFDRERDVLHTSRISKEDFHQCFRDSKNQLASRFKVEKR